MSNSSFSSKIEPSDIIAVVALLGGLVLKSQGLNGDVSLMIIAIISYYFGYSSFKKGTLLNQQKNE
jgi:hypothetical protein